jgi:hypothetical protein
MVAPSSADRIGANSLTNLLFCQVIFPDSLLLPFGRPGRRLVMEECAFLASALALLAAFSASLRITCSTHTGNARRAWVLINDNVKKASPGTGLPYRLEKHRSRP